jgi:hypothetical protein
VELLAVKDLSRLETAFAEGVVAGKTATQAAVDAGYAPTHARNRGSKLLKKPKIRAYIELRRATAVAAAEQATNITLARIFEELGHVALLDPKDLFDEKGRLLPLHEMPEHARRAISSFDVDETYELSNRPTSGKDVTTTGPNGAAIVSQTAPIEPEFELTRTTKVRFWPKLQALENIAKLAGYLKQDQKLEGEVVLRWADD